MLAFDQAPGFSPLFTKLPTKARDVNSCYSRSNMSSIHEPLKKKDQRSSRVKTPAKIVEEERMRRRHLSLAKVKESGEARRWVARSEQVSPGDRNVDVGVLTSADPISRSQVTAHEVGRRTSEVGQAARSFHGGSRGSGNGIARIQHR